MGFLNINRTTMVIIMKGLGCLGFVVLSIAFVLYLITSMAMNGTALEGEKVNTNNNNNTNSNVIDLGTLELRDDNSIEEQGEQDDEKSHAKESKDYYKNGR